MIRALRKQLARAIIIDRATPGNASFIERIARERSEENYRFASRFAAGKSVLDVGGGTGIGHDLLLGNGARSIVSIDRHIAATAQGNDPRVSSVRGDFIHDPLPQDAFDLILCLGTLFYLSDSRAALERMHKLLRPEGTLIINCINQKLIRQYFKMPLEEVDEKFSAAYDETGLRALLKRQFRSEPEFYVQQPVPVAPSLSSRLAFWVIPLTWPFRRHPVIPRPAGTEGMYVCAVVSRNG